jgi:membrane-associated phospholipid phosphatase
MWLCPEHGTQPSPPSAVAPRRARAVRSRPAWRRRPGQLSLFLAAYVLYDAARWIFSGHLPQARAHAEEIIDLERSAHVAIEGQIQRALDSGAPAWLLSNVYLAAQLVVLPGALIWLYRRSPAVYRRLRDTVVATWLIAVPIFALYPVAPPRLAGIGIADTVSSQAGVALTGHSTLFYNPYAAVPSLHVGFAFAIAIAAAAAARARWAKALAVLWGPLVTLSVIATGNHYVFDVAAGLLVTGLGFASGRLTSRLSPQRFSARGASALVRATQSRA